MFRWDHLPRRGDKFHDSSRGPGKGNNGIIIHVLWDEDPKEVLVKFFVNKQFFRQMPAPGKGQALPEKISYDLCAVESYTFDEIEGRWTDKFGGSWVLDEGEDRAKPIC